MPTFTTGCQVELRGGVALFGGQPEPAHGLAVVLRDTLTVVIHDPKAELRVGVALFSASAEILQLLVGHLPTGAAGGGKRRRQRGNDRAARERQAPGSHAAVIMAIRAPVGQRRAALSRRCTIAEIITHRRPALRSPW